MCLWPVDSVLLEVKDVYLSSEWKTLRPLQGPCWVIGRNFSYSHILEALAYIVRKGDNIE